MNYKSLYKQFVMNDNQKFEELYKNKFNSSSSVKFDLYIKDYQAFFTYDVEIMKLISKIKELDNKVNKLLRNLPVSAINQYLRKSMVEEIEYSNKIESIVTSKNDINNTVNEIEKKIYSKNRLKGIVEKYFLMNDEELKLETSIDIRKLYDEMLYAEIILENPNNLPDGKVFRKDSVHVYNGDRSIHNGIVPEDKIINYMDKALNILNDSEIDILIRVAIFHYLFGYIHPFYDGNGRINRFISSYALSKNYNKIIGYKLSMLIYQNLSTYYEAFNHTNDIRNRADISTFIYSFLYIVYQTYIKIEEEILEVIKKYDYYKDIVSSLTILNKLEKDFLLLLVQTSIFKESGITKMNIQNILNKGNTTITAYLSKFRNLELLNEETSGRYVYYSANLKRIDDLTNKE